MFLYGYFWFDTGSVNLKKPWNAILLTQIYKMCHWKHVQASDNLRTLKYLFDRNLYRVSQKKRARKTTDKYGAV